MSHPTGVTPLFVHMLTGSTRKGTQDASLDVQPGPVCHTGSRQQGAASKNVRAHVLAPTQQHQEATRCVLACVSATQDTSVGLPCRAGVDRAEGRVKHVGCCCKCIGVSADQGLKVPPRVSTPSKLRISRQEAHVGRSHGRVAGCIKLQACGWVWGGGVGWASGCTRVVSRRAGVLGRPDNGGMHGIG